MPAPSKPSNNIKTEGKSHRTKKGLLERKQAEESLLTGEKLKEAKEIIAIIFMFTDAPPLRTIYSKNTI